MENTQNYIWFRLLKSKVFVIVILLFVYLPDDIFVAL